MTTVTPVGAPHATEKRIDLRSPRSGPDFVFRVGLIACASTVLVSVGAIFLFLSIQARLAWSHFHLQLFTDTWSPNSFKYGFKGDLVGSVIIALIALIVATPISLATALAINEYVPRRFRRPLVGLVDLLAALPSIIYGLWGALFLDLQLRGTFVWLGHHAAFFPPFRLDSAQVGGGLLEAGIVVGIMVLPIMSSVSREVMSQVPREDCEAAVALGGTRWGMITTVILPFSRNGIVGGAMLAMGRALGETIAVTLILHNNEQITSHILQPRGGAIAPLIVTYFQGVSKLEQSSLTAAGLTLFAVTLLVNVGARLVVSRSRGGARR